jgi:DNA-binding CsgD family transcriptional regulator
MRVSSTVDTHALLKALQYLDGRSRLLLDRDGRLVWASDEAVREFWEATGLAIQRGRLDRTCNRHQQEIRLLLDVRKGRTETAFLRTGRGKEPLFIHATAIDERHVCWVLATGRSASEARLPDLQESFGLTPCESNIISDLYEGRTPQEIARLKHSSIHTIRAHIRNSYRKLSVNCREELWVKLNSCTP